MRRLPHAVTAMAMLLSLAVTAVFLTTGQAAADSPYQRGPDPTLQSVEYNFVTNEVSGNCTIPSSPTNFNGNTTTFPCMHGTFDQGQHLYFNITSQVPLNNTLDANATSSFTSQLGIQDSPWTFWNQAPSLILHQLDPQTNALGPVVLRTAVSKPHDCTELKVCLSGVDGRAGSQVGAEVLAPLGIVLMRVDDYGITCTTPSDN